MRKNWILLDIGEVVAQGNLYTAGGSNWDNHFGKQFGSVVKWDI